MQNSARSGWFDRRLCKYTSPVEVDATDFALVEQFACPSDGALATRERLPCLTERRITMGE